MRFQVGLLGPERFCESDFAKQFREQYLRCADSGAVNFLPQIGHIMSSLRLGVEAWKQALEQYLAFLALEGLT